MFSKLAFSAAALTGAQAALISASGTLTSDMTCHECLTMANSQYCATETTYGRHDFVTASTGKCISSTSTCSSGTGIKVGSNGIVEAAHLACPTQIAVCGPTSSQWTIVPDPSFGEFTQGPPGGLASKEGCAWGFKTRCGVPVIKSTGNIASDTKIALFHFTLDERMTMSDLATDSAGVQTYYPTTSTPIHNLHTTCSGIQCSKPNEAGVQFLFRKTSSNEVVQTTDILTQYLEYIKAKSMYQSLYVAYLQEQKIEQREAADDARESNPLWKFFFAWWIPPPDYVRTSGTIVYTYPGAYSGQKWGELNSLGGWGDLSVQSMDPSSGEYYEYGVFGSVSTEPANSVDLNNADCAPRYTLVSVYNPSTAALTSADVKFSAKSYSVPEYSGNFQVPKDADELGEGDLSGATAKTLGLIVLSGAVLAATI